MATSDQKTAIELADRLVETAKSIAESVRKRPDDSPLLKDTCERLGRVIDELVTVVRP